MEAADDEESKIDRHIAGLMAVIMDHLSRCGRLVFSDLLIYMDCLSLLLDADGFSEEEIRELYPIIAHSIVELYPGHIKSSPDCAPFKNSPHESILEKMASSRADCRG